MIVGIDPGLTGGVAMLTNSGDFVHGMRMPVIEWGKRKLIDVAAVEGWFNKYRPSGLDGVLQKTVVEAPNSMPRQGLQSTYNFGRHCGALEAWALSHGRIELVTPAVWKKALKLGSDKRASLGMAKMRLGSCDGLWEVAANEGIAEAALIALWWHGAV